MGKIKSITFLTMYLLLLFSFECWQCFVQKLMHCGLLQPVLMCFEILSILISHSYLQLFACSFSKLSVKYDGTVDSSLAAVFSALSLRELCHNLGLCSRLDQTFSLGHFIPQRIISKLGMMVYLLPFVFLFCKFLRMWTFKIQRSLET